jgi:DNA-binding MarR family transcriptional regulator
MAVNQPQVHASPAAADARLYLRDQELDRGAALIRAAARRLEQLTRSPAADLPAPELEALVEVHDVGPIDVSRLRARLGAAKQSLTRALNALEGRGLVRRVAGGSDRRTRLVTLTPEGARLAAEAAERRREALREAYRLAGPDAVAGAARVLARIARTAADS